MTSTKITKTTNFFFACVLLVSIILFLNVIPLRMGDQVGSRYLPEPANTQCWAPAPYRYTISGFSTPYGIAVNSTGHVYVVDFNNHRIQVFDNTGQNIYAIGNGQGTANGQFQYPTGVCVNSSDHVYVADNANHRIQVFDNAGKFLYAFGSYGVSNGLFYSPYGVGVNTSDHVYVADSGNDRVQVFDNAGQYLYTIGSGQFNSPSRVAINGTGHVYVADSFNHRVQVFDNSGQYLYTIGSLWYPYGVAIDDNTGHVYIADTSNNRVQVIDNAGHYLYTIGGNGAGSANDQFNNPMAIAVNSTGHVYVVDRNNARVQVFGQPAWVAEWGINAGDMVYWNMTLLTCQIGNPLPNATGLFNTTMLGAGHGDVADLPVTEHNFFALFNASLSYFNASLGAWTSFLLDDAIGAVNFTIPVTGMGAANFVLLASPLFGGVLNTTLVNTTAYNYFALYGAFANPTYVTPISVNLTLPGGSYWNVTYDQDGLATAYYAYFSPVMMGADQFILRHAVRSALSVPPSAPTLTLITPPMSIDGRISLSWGSVNGATSYSVYRDLNVITSVAGLNPIATGLTATSYTDNLSDNGTYYYVILAVNATGSSPISNCVNVKVAIPPTSPGTIDGTSVLLLFAVGGLAVVGIYRKLCRPLV